MEVFAFGDGRNVQFMRDRGAQVKLEKKPAASQHEFRRVCQAIETCVKFVLVVDEGVEFTADEYGCWKLIEASLEFMRSESDVDMVVLGMPPQSSHVCDTRCRENNVAFVRLSSAPQWNVTLFRQKTQKKLPTLVVQDYQSFVSKNHIETRDISAYALRIPIARQQAATMVAKMIERVYPQRCAFAHGDPMRILWVVLGLIVVASVLKALKTPRQP